MDALDSEDFIRGRRAGLMGLSGSTLELRPSDPQDDEYLRGLRSGAEERASKFARQRACTYGRKTVCDCGGNGHCLEVA